MHDEMIRVAGVRAYNNNNDKRNNMGATTIHDDSADKQN